MNERDNHNSFNEMEKALDKCPINFTIFKNLKLRIEEKQTSFICKKLSIKYLASYFVYLEEWN